MPSLLDINNTVTRQLRKVTGRSTLDQGQEPTKSDIKRHERHVQRQELLRRKSLDDKPHVAKLKGLEHKPADDISFDRYGKVQAHELKDKTYEGKPLRIEAISASMIGERVTFRGRIQTERAKSTKLEFYLFRQRDVTIQGILTVEEGIISEEMVRWAEHIPKESVVVIDGLLQAPPHPIKSATFSDVEVKVERIYVVAAAAKLPFRLEDAMIPFSAEEDGFENIGSPLSATSATSLNGDGNDTDPKVTSDPSLPTSTEQSSTIDGHVYHGSRVEMHTRLDNRVFDLRTPVNQSIFRINSAVCRFFRSHLDSLGFTEIHTPKLQSSGSEGGANVFKVDYFKRTAYLAQSPQLFKQMCIAADMERVYEVGPVFRAENSNTHRHLTEYTGLDLEMVLSAPAYDYREARSIIDGMFISIFEGLAKEYQREITNVGRQFPVPPFEWRSNTGEGTLILQFKDAVKMLGEAGTEWPDDEDLDTPTERFLGQLVKEKYGTDFYILDKFPASARPFYTMPDGDDKKYTNSFDIFMRGQEVLSGGQRIHDPDQLAKNLGLSGIDPEDLKDYMNAFRWGMEPHAGGGIGLERVVMLYLNLGNIRWASLFPRDPKSIPAKQRKMVLKTTPHPMNGFIAPPREYDEDKFGHRIPKGSAAHTEKQIRDKIPGAAQQQADTKADEAKDVNIAVEGNKPDVVAKDSLNIKKEATSTKEDSKFTAEPETKTAPGLPIAGDPVDMNAPGEVNGDAKSPTGVESRAPGLNGFP